jgi:hypothetical protein
MRRVVQTAPQPRHFEDPQMKKTTATAAAIALVAIAGWSGLWFAGRGAVADRLDREVTQLQAQGYEVTYGAREIGGFPFGYSVTHRDVTIGEPTSGATYRLPEITTEVTAADVERLTTRFPAKYRIDLPLDEAQRAGWPGMPEVLAIDVESSDLVLVSDDASAAGQQIALTAASMLIVTGSPDQPLNFALDLTALDARGALPALSSGLPATSATTVDRLDYAYTSTTPDGVAATVEASIDNLRVTGKSDVRDQAGLLALMTGGTGTSSLTYQTGATEGVVRAGRAPTDPGGTLNFSIGSTAGTFSLANGIFEIATSSKANRLTLTTAASPDTPPDTPLGKPFGGELRAIEMHISGPFAPSATMAPIALRFALDNFVPDAAFWQLIDAGNKLPHDPARLVIDIEGNARITDDLAKHRPGDPAPFEIGNVSILAADITALGAGVATSGNVKFLQPQNRPLNQPVGTVTVTLTKAKELMIKLADAGLIDPTTVQTAILLSAGFTSPGTAPGELVTKIMMSGDGISVNGQLIGGN